jgi:hypothetical protein
VIVVTLITGIMFVLSACMHFWVWGILRRCSACAATACEVVSDCRIFERHWPHRYRWMRRRVSFYSLVIVFSLKPLYPSHCNLKTLSVSGCCQYLRPLFALFRLRLHLPGVPVPHGRSWARRLLQLQPPQVDACEFRLLCNVVSFDCHCSITNIGIWEMFN